MNNAKPTGFCGINAKALIPEAADQDVAVVGSNHKTVRVDLYALVHQVGDLTLVHAWVICFSSAQRRQRVNEGIEMQHG